METMLPFGLPAPTALYLGLYAVTLVAHILMMGYVVAGTAFAGADALLRRRDATANASAPTVAPLLRDWLPFALGAAITAGVAPLLFVQVLYKRGFYTANLLLFHRWMALVPVLIIGFYLLYLLKSRFVDGTSASGRRRLAAVAAVAVACFVFAAWSWTENHLLSTAGGAWVDMYRSGAMTYREPAVLLRLSVWIGGTFPIMAALAGLQLAAAERRAGTPASHSQWRALAAAALAGFAVAAAGAIGYATTLDGATRDAMWSPATQPYAVAAGVGVAAQLAVWLAQLRAGAPRGRLATVATVAVAVTVLGVTTVREAIRIARVDIATLFDQHARIAAAPGLWLFLGLLAVNAATIVWLALRVRGELSIASTRR
jgi:hypothetical protein